ncbi:hypothetical protein CG747_29385 [Streptomyces sp. CB02959]|uniref:hypothetical protein n=1 Tax=Streptomyces sp. CB02959 TaxID=2020330 RepID=UPI000C277762|nr:hypothetical protein [Streptomyces sp. CB02959]PJN37392.1 hypothetical protein CG747_29385 [Streptomyces sp. CB02959]
MTYDPDNPQQPGSALRLLPWSTWDGRPCYLAPSGDGNGFLSRRADRMEAQQMRNAAHAFTDAQTTLRNEAAGPLLLRLTLIRTTAALANTLRIADSRLGRLPGPADNAPDDEDPVLPTSR